MTRERREIPKGYTCKCDKFHKFDLYVYAHPYDPLLHNCECGRVNTIKNLRVVRSRLAIVKEAKNGSVGCEIANGKVTKIMVYPYVHPGEQT